MSLISSSALPVTAVSPRSHVSTHAFPHITLVSKPKKIRFPPICAFPFASEKPVHFLSPVPFLAVSAVSAGFLFFRSFLKVLPPDFSDRWHQLLAFSEGAETKVTQLPYHLIQAVMASEDRRFFYHLGVDPYGVGRAVVYFPNGGGGSTITQQLVKNVFLTHERKMSRKFVEGILSLILERRLSKWRILYSYLNKMYWGHGKFGIESASLFYFGKHPALLNVGESALLAGILPAPETLSPYTNPQKGKYSQARVLRRMVAAGFLDLETALKIVSQPLSLRADGPVPANVEQEMFNTQIREKSAIKNNWDWEMANASWEMRDHMEKWALMKNKSSQ
ncbi:Peptidoglycan glycosyltransferase protein [Dioscorea alata]|uniref:Peptidoglycan glycosyltransferase protein n=2 Tax=Dioscorea alata TaxID=55571 RepID=A0ACB7U301_DIOAL|nr:Peptidoglycan glycosyltransferase protein [Dioscorea alata]KAH7654696.1 Peptidoglycan glycosyltransferase protein [Dioscorea alata]